MSAWWPSYPVWAVVGLLHRHGVSWNVLERVFWLWPCVLLLIAAPYRFLLRRGVTPAAAAIGAAVFGFNTWTIGLIQRGHIPALIAFAIMPIVIDALIDLLETPSRRTILTLAAIATLQIMYEIRYTYLTVIVCVVLIAIMFARSPGRFLQRRTIYAGAAGALAIIALNIYWLIPALLSPPELPNPSTLSVFYETSGELSLLNALALYFPYYHASVIYPPFQVHAVEPAFLSLLVAAALGLYLSRRRRWAWFIAIVGMAAVVMVSGPKSTFAPLVVFVFKHFPGMSAFRDLTKFMSILSFAFAVAIAFAANRLIGYVRLRRHTRAGSVIAAASLALLTLLMYDAYDPFRMQTFAATHIRPADVALQQFINTAPGNGSVLLFPSNFPSVDGSLRHTVLMGSDVAQGVTPHGFAALNDADAQSTIFALFDSVIGPHILAEIGLQYVVVVDDPTNWDYLPGFDNVQRGKSIAFFDNLPWLKRYKKIGNNIIYDVTGSANREAAFYATCPLSFVADTRSLRALRDTPFEQGRPGIVLADEQPPSTDLSLIPNVLAGVLSADKFDETAKQSQLGDQDGRPLQRLRTVMDNAQYAAHDYRAFAITQEAMLPSGDGRAPFLKASWNAAESGKWRIAAQLQAPTLDTAPVRIAQLGSALELPRAELGRPILTPGALSAEYAGAAVAGVNWSLSSANTIIVSNPFDEPIRADLTVSDLRATGRWPQIVRLEGSGNSASVYAPPAFAAILPGARLDLRSVLLQPGANRFTLFAPADGEQATGPLVVAAAPALKNVVFLADNDGFSTLAVAERARKNDVTVLIPTQGNDPKPARRRLRVFANLNIPMSRLPAVSLRYHLSTDALGAYAAYGLRTMDGRIVELRKGLGESGNLLGFSIYGALVDAYQSISEEAVQNHQGDVPWLVEHASYPPDLSGAVLQYVDLVIVKPAGAELRQTSSLDISNASVSVSASDTYNGPFQKTLQTVDLSRTSASALTHGRFSIAGVRKSPEEFALSLSYAPPSQASEPTTFVPGDIVAVQLNSGRSLNGRVVSVSPETIVLANGGQQVGIQRSALATIERVVQADSGDVVVRIPANFDLGAGTLHMLMQTPPWLAYSMRIAVSVHGSKRLRFLAPTDALDLSDVDPPVPAKWMGTQPRQAQAPIQPFAAIYDANSPPLPSPAWTSLDLDLQAIFAQNPQLVAPRVQFLEIRFRPQISDVGSATGSVFLSNVQFQYGGVNSPPQELRSAARAIHLDGQSLNWHVATGDTGTYALAQSTTQQLPQGPHTLETVGRGSPDVQSVLVADGQPVCNAADPQFRAINESEIVGTTAYVPGLLIGNMAYDEGWRMALLPDGLTPSGNIFRDFLAVRTLFVPEALHYLVNGDLNGWWTNARHRNVLMIFLPTLYAYAAAFLEIPVIIILTLAFTWKLRS